MSKLEAVAERNYVPEVARAAIHTGLGDKNSAIESVEKACQQSSSSVKVFSLNVAPMWDPLRPEPRFQALLRSTGFPQSTSVNHGHFL
jgi:hypothetical protein